MQTVTSICRTTCLLLAGFVFLFTINAFSQDIEIYVSDAGNFTSPPWQILKFDENGENPEIFIDTVLAWPQDILFLEDQQVVLISNLNTGRITKYNSSTGEYIEDFATGIGGPTRMKIGADSLIYVLQWSGNGKVRRYQLNGTFVDEFTSVGVTQSIGIDWDDDGNLYVSSYGGASIRKFDSDGNDLGIFINSNLAGPTNIWFDDNGDLLVIDYNGTSVKRFNSNGVFINNFITGLGSAEGVDFFPNGNILIGNGATHSVKMYDSNGVYIEDFIPNGSGGLINPNAVVIRETNVSSVSSDENSLKEMSFKLEQNYPNPFNPSTKIKFSIPYVIASETKQSRLVTLKIFNILGKEIATLVNEELPAGQYEVEFIPSSVKPAYRTGRHHPSSGIYFYQLRAGTFVQTKKMVYLK
ncbi:MAG: T9SS type A sorting domain-containing protein [Ignavibacteriaceae bacterium]|nr:T9SS type A sorting domain-containing protein [Ignavibacteriaceae bacterium]